MGEVYDSQKIQRDIVKLGSNFTLPEKSLNIKFMIAFMLTDECMSHSLFAKHFESVCLLTESDKMQIV